MTSIELKHQARLQEWAGAIRDCRSSGLSVSQAVVQGERNHTNYILSLETGAIVCCQYSEGTV